MCEVMHQQAHLVAIEKQMIEIIENNLEFKEIFNRLMCMHGIDKIAACASILEVYDFKYFKRLAQFSSYLGPVPS